MMRLVAERLVEMAIEDKCFDYSVGRGKPLKLLESPLEDPSWCLSFHILKNAGMRPLWLELDLEIRQKLKESLEELRKASSVFDIDEPAWERSVGRFNDRIEDVNNLIQELNLKVPHYRFQRVLIEPDREIYKILLGR
jgi:hypothetical protein